MWVEVLLIKETRKAILIMFDDKEVWLPKAWIVRIKACKHSKTLKIKISEYHWTKKF